MERLRKTLSFRRKKKTPESSKPHQWQEDEKKVREGTCSFQVKYLGSVEVFESRGMQVCEEAVKVLYQNMKKATRFSFRKKPRGSRPVYATLYISGDSLRVVEDRSHMDAVTRITATGSDELNKGLIVDQTIEKVSFCAPDRNHDKAFAYICRDGTTRRWLCHAFLALKESGERLSHAVGCAFAVCLEKKQKREREAVQVTYSDDKTTFTRMGSFRQTTLTERMIDPQSAIVPDPVPSTSTAVVAAAAAAAGGSGNNNSSGSSSSSKPAVETAVRERPQATPDAFMRLGSFREFPKLSAGTSPFKRQLSLRLNELPSNVDRQQHEFSRTSAGAGHDNEAMHGGGAVGPAAVSGGTSLAGALTDPSTALQQQTNSEPFDPIAAMCQQLAQDLSSMTAASRDAGSSVTAAANGLSPAPSSATHQMSQWPGVSTGAVQLPPPAAAAGSTQWATTAAASSSGGPANGWQIGGAVSTSNQVSAPVAPTVRLPPPGGLARATAKTIPASQQAPPQQQLTTSSGTGSYWSSASATNTVFSSSTATTQPLHRPTAAPAHAKFSAAAPVSNRAAPDADPFDAAWAMRTTASSAANPFLPGAQQPQHQQQQQHLHRHTKHTAAASGSVVTKTFEMKM